MPVDIDSKEGHIIRKMIPFSTMPNNIFKVICGKISIESARSGTFLFKRGQTNNDLIYLLKGDVSLEVAPLKIETIKSGTESARFALAHQFPRKVNALAKGSVRFLRLNTVFINPPGAKEFEKKEFFEIKKAQKESSQSLMATLLMIPIIRSLPEPNLEKIKESLEEIEVKADDVIISQGDYGDYYYLIKQGECLVSHKNSKHAHSIKIAKLQVWDTFGEGALISGEPRGETITAVSNMSLLRLHKDKFLKLIKEPSLEFIYFIELELLLNNEGILLDVRSPDEFDKLHLPGAVNAPLFSLRIQLKVLDKGKTYVIICKNGKMSESAAFLMKSYKFDVKIIKDGMEKLPKEALKEALKTIQSGGSHKEEVFAKVRTAVKANTVLSLRNMNESLLNENTNLRQSLKELQVKNECIEKEKVALKEQYKILFKQTERFKLLLNIND